MTEAQLKRRGFTLLAKSKVANSPYKVQHSHTNRTISLHEDTDAHHGAEYFEAVDKQGCIMLIPAEIMEPFDAYI